MMKQHTRVLALGLTCTALLSLATPAMAARQNTSTTPISASGTTSVTIPSDGTLAFSQIGERVKANNLTLKAAEESLKQAKAMDWDDAIDEMEDAIDNLDIQISQLLNGSSAQLDQAKKDLESSLSSVITSTEGLSGLGDVIKNTINVSTLTTLSQYGKMQAESLKSTKESLEDQLDDLKEQKQDYQKTLKDTERQIDYAADQTISGAESLYLTILSTQLQLDGLKNNTLASTQRSLKEIELRYQLGQVSKLTLTQVQNGYESLASSITSLENTVSTLYSSLQSLMGDVPTGKLRLLDTPSVTADELSYLNYASDLSKAKEKSYTLYTADRAVEDAEDAMNDARRDEGKNSYQYKMAEYAYQSSIYKKDAAVASFEASFLNLYKAIAPAQTALAAKQSALAYEQQMYAVAEKKYQLGNLSANALQDAKDTLDSAQRDVEAAQLDLFTAYHSYDQAVKLGLVSSSNG
ncbi:MAG: TolC family protein [Firmicutes bacterium]|nr:TolC family protein [Bacillota bacterium]